jgi:hypothetical protein
MRDIETIDWRQALRSLIGQSGIAGKKITECMRGKPHIVHDAKAALITAELNKEF